MNVQNRCPDCGGSGETQAVYHDDPCLVPGVQPCDKCNGTGIPDVLVNPAWLSDELGMHDMLSNGKCDCDEWDAYDDRGTFNDHLANAVIAAAYAVGPVQGGERE